MRKIFAIIGAVLLALAIGIFIFLNPDKNFFSDDKTSPRLPTLPSVEDEAKENENLNLTYEQRLEKGDYYFERGFLSYAVNEYVKAANLEPDEITPYLKLTEAHMQLRNYPKALTNAQLALERNPNDTKTRFQVLLIHIKLSDFQTAKNLIESQFATTTDHQVLYYKGLLAALFENHEEAKKQLNAAKINATPEFLDKISKFQKAYAEFEVTKAAEPVFLSELLTKSFNEVQEYEMAIFTIKKVLTSRPNLRDGWILLGFAYLNLQKPQFALTAFEKAHSIDGTWAPTLYFLGLVNKELANYQAAINHFNAALKANFKPKAVIDDQLADLYFQTKDYAKSAAAYEEVLKVNKTDIDAFVRPIWIYVDYLNQPNKALALAQASALAFPESAMSYNLLGWSYIGLGDYKRALSNLNRAIKIDPRLAAAHFNLGLLYEKQSKNQLALKSYQDAYQLDTAGSIGSKAAVQYNAILEKEK